MIHNTIFITQRFNYFFSNIRVLHHISVSNSPLAYQFISNRLKNNKSILKVVSTSYLGYDALPIDVFKNRKLVKSIIKNEDDRLFYKDLPYFIRNNRKYALRAIKQFGIALYPYLSEYLQNDKDIFKACLDNRGILPTYYPVISLQTIKSRFPKLLKQALHTGGIRIILDELYLEDIIEDELLKFFIKRDGFVFLID